MDPNIKLNFYSDGDKTRQLQNWLNSNKNESGANKDIRPCALILRSIFNHFQSFHSIHKNAQLPIQHCQVMSV